MAAAIATRPVYRVPLVENDSRWAPPGAARREARAAGAAALPARPATEATEPLLFELEGVPTDALPPVEPVTYSARQVHSTIVRLLSPNEESVPVYSAARLAVGAAAGDLAAAADILQRVGWDARVLSSPGGSLRSLRHTYLTATQHTRIRGERAEWVIDPSFATAFVVADPTPRFAHILSAVPQLVVAPLPRLLRALLVLANELERCFKARGVPLPPWRSADALTTRYEAPAPTRAAPPSAAARQNARQHAQTESVQLKLLRMGLGLGLDEQQGSAEQQGVTPHSPLAPASSSGSDTGEAAGESPESVIQAAQRPLRAFPTATKAPERFCRGWPEQWRMGGRQERWRLTASAA
ncbi:DUF506 family [Micractinium conductrix]|uniref:DUF506 family n=1 Tax=Micractinium conductrix TaxID=554055 RepID=A0A2P6V474_9CHLO|nr:DUF506 family [Micractinium conductrix]|eukprot:PSC68891.1 DUF506 family [Micractinium conductrix]